MNKTKKKEITRRKIKYPSPYVYYQIFNYWGTGESTQYKYSEKELFYLTQGV